MAINMLLVNCVVVQILWAFVPLVLFSDFTRFGVAVHGQIVNHQPYFVPGSGDMSRFSLSENTPVDSPVYQLKGKICFSVRISHTNTLKHRHTRGVVSACVDCKKNINLKF